MLKKLIELKVKRRRQPSREGVAAQRQTSARTTTSPTPTSTPMLSPVSAVEEKAAPASRARKNNHVRRDRDAAAPRARQLQIISRPRQQEPEGQKPPSPLVEVFVPKEWYGNTSAASQYGGGRTPSPLEPDRKKRFPGVVPLFPTIAPLRVSPHVAPRILGPILEHPQRARPHMVPSRPRGAPKPPKAPCDNHDSSG